MKSKRREILAVVAAGGVGSLSGCSQIEELLSEFRGGNGDGEGESSSLGPQRSLDTGSRVKTALEKQAPRRPAPDFSYDPIATTVQDSSLISEFRAQPATDNDGDYLQITPATRGDTDLVGLLRAIWNVPEAESAEVTINGSTVQLNGGEAFNTGILLGQYRHDSGPDVVAIRATSVETAKELTSGAPFPLPAQN